MNCDEYYSYNALAGLVKSGEEEAVKNDPWELVTEAVSRMKRNGDVMRADRLKQVMQQIDSSFDEKNLGMSKFSRFVQEAAQRGLLSLTKLENGQLEVGLPGGAARRRARRRAVAAADEASRVDGAEPAEDRKREGRGRRGRRGRGRDREDRAAARRARRGRPARRRGSIDAGGARRLRSSRCRRRPRCEPRRCRLAALAPSASERAPRAEAASRSASAASG